MANIGKKERQELFRSLLLPRKIEEKMLLLLRQGKISKWFSGIGQEAISVGCTKALEAEDTIFTMHRNLGVFTSRNIPLRRLFSQWEGKAAGFTKGRDRSFHFGAPEYNIIGMISHLGPQLSFAAGAALASKMRKENSIALAFTGEGGTSQGEFHEALNTAAVWQLPVIFVIENNGYGLSTTTAEQYACKNLAERGPGYGMESLVIDGNDIEAVFSTIKKIRKKMVKDPQPWLVECKTFRMRGHEEASGTKYVPQSLMDEWAEKDPIENYRKTLIKEGVLDAAFIQAEEERIQQYIAEELEVSFAETPIEADVNTEVGDVYASCNQPVIRPEGQEEEMRYVDAIADGLKTAMNHHANLILMGQDIAEYGGVFKVTEGLYAEFGKDRVRNTPLCESAILGIAMGLSLKGYKSMVEMQFADFVTCGFNQIVNNLAKTHYRWGQHADVVIRMPTGGTVGAGPFHSQSNEAWFVHTPGLKVVYPSSPRDAKGLLLAALQDPNPVLFFEHKALYRQIQGPVPSGYYTEEIGKARIARAGNDLTIITYGIGVHWATQYADQSGVSIEVLDLRCLLPLDEAAIFQAVRKTNRAIILHEDTLTGGIGGEIAALIAEHCFDQLDAPVIRLGGLDTPIPFARNLEDQFMANARLSKAVEKILQY